MNKVDIKLDRDSTGIISVDCLDKLLQAYYLESYGERYTDIWYEQPAANVYCFKRDNKYISLKCHILNGEITEHIEKEKS